MILRSKHSCSRYPPLGAGSSSSRNISRFSSQTHGSLFLWERVGAKSISFPSGNVQSFHDTQIPGAMISFWSGLARPAMMSPGLKVKRLVFLVAVFGICVSISSSQTAKQTDPADIEVLTAFRNTLTNSRQQLPNWFQGGDPCNHWTGVMCLESDYPAIVNRTFLHVTELRLLRYNLTGTLAPELGNLKALKILDVMWNRMDGSIPDTFGKLTNLFLLLLNGNQFSGSLPDSLGNLLNLNRIQIDENDISGPVPLSFQNLTAIEHLHMNNNSINGSIPPELGKLQNVVHLLLDNNNLAGTLPPELANMSKLMILQLDNNRFDDGTTIPKEYMEIPTLLKLSLRNCNLEGEIPDLSLSTKLGVLDLSENKLDGSIPSFPPEMTAIDLSENDLNGTVPTELGSLGNLSYLLLSDNNISGSIPTSLGSAPIYSDPSSRFIWDFQNNNISSWPNNASLLQLPTNKASFWFAGNPLCTGQTLSVNCQPNTVGSALQVGGVINSSSNIGTTCSNKCSLPFRLVPNAEDHKCQCRVPIIVWYRLKSPGFNVFDLYERGFLVYISSALSLSVDQVDIFDYTYEPGPRLSMHLHIFPTPGDRFNESETQRISDAFTLWDMGDDPIFGPYELLRITVFSLVSGGSNGISTGGAIAGIIVGIVGGAAIGMAVVFFVIRKRRKSHPRARKPFGNQGRLSTIKATGLREWTWEEMEQYTNKFSDTNVLGVGGFGKVYVGVLPDGSKVAIKHSGLAAGSTEQFDTEIELLSRVHHRNLVELKGFCQDEETGDQFLVYEYMENGSVEDHLPPHSNTPLDFPTRLRVALGAARGINYLHTEAYPPIYHRDIKASNILLDTKFHAKVADFGVSKNAPEPDEEGGVGGGVDTLVKGTPGYLDPEYCLTHTLTDKSDVYSFGVFLMVLLTGRQAITQGKNIVRQVLMARDADLLWSLVDTYMAGQCPVDIADTWAKLSLRCCAQDPTDRPSMTEVVKELDMLHKDCALFRSDMDSTPPSTNTTMTMTSDDGTQSFPSMTTASTIVTHQSGINLMGDYDGIRSDE